MKLPLLAVLGLAAATYASEGVIPEDDGSLYKGPFGFPPGVAPPAPEYLPHKGPPKGGKKPVPMWHPPHKGVVIDDCEDDGNDKWHWAGPGKGGKGGKPHWPPHKWTTSTITATKTKTVIDCDDGVKECPGHPKTKYTTTTVEVTTTVCPVPVTDEPHQPPKPTHVEPAPPAEETDAAPEPAPEPEAPAPVPEAPPADVTEAPDASAAPVPPPVEAAAPKAAAGVLAIAAAFAALF